LLGSGCLICSKLNAARTSHVRVPRTGLRLPTLVHGVVLGFCVTVIPYCFRCTNVFEHFFSLIYWLWVQHLLCYCAMGWVKLKYVKKLPYLHFGILRTSGFSGTLTSKVLPSAMLLPVVGNKKMRAWFPPIV